MTGGRRLRAAAGLGYLLVGGTLLAFLLSRVSAAELIASLRRADPVVLGLTLVAGLAVTVLRAVRFGMFFRPGARWADLYGVFALFRLFKFALPFHSGELALLALLKRRGLSPSIAEATPVWLMLRATDLVAVTLILSATLSLVDAGPEVEALRWLLLVCAAALATGLLLPDRVMAALVSRVGSSSWIGGRLAAVHTGVRHTRSWRKIVATLVLSISLWLLMAATATLAQRAFASPLQVRQCVAAAVASQAMSILPVHAPLGIGTDDAIWTGLMVAFGLPLGGAVAITLSVRMALIGTVAMDSLIGGLVLGVAGSRRQVSRVDPE